MSDRPLISIIVPFYNVAEYAPYCLDSLINQDFSNYEIVCIDDGSTDSTGRVLDDYEHQFKEVIVYHKANGGLSDARNFGVQRSRGELITFVDGDDIVSPHYLPALYRALNGMKSCIVMGGFKTLSFISDVKSGQIDWDEAGSSRRLSRKEAFKAVLLDEIQPSAWAKLAPRWVYENIPFPLGVRYEEIRTVLDFLLQVESYVHLDQKIYGYVMREGSITWSKTIDYVQLEEYREAIDIICSKAEKEYPELSDYVSYQRVLLDTRAHSQMPKGARKNAAVRKIDKEIIQSIKDELPVVLFGERVPLINKLRFTMLAYMRPVYDILYKLFRNYIKKVR